MNYIEEKVEEFRKLFPPTKHCGDSECMFEGEDHSIDHDSETALNYLRTALTEVYRRAREEERREIAEEVEVTDKLRYLET